MSTRFLVLVIPAKANAPTWAAVARARRQARGAGLAEVHASSALVVLAEGTFVDLGPQGVVMGTLFTREATPRRVLDLPRSTAEAIGRSGGTVLRDAFWGGYVAALNGGADAAPAVLRDPSGAVNCLCRVVDGLVLAASDLATLLDASGPAPVDWDYVAINAANLTAAPQATALAGVMELPPGTIARPGAPLDFAPIWSPWTYARQAAPVADTELPALIETTVKDCVSAWAQTFSHVSLGVSGGLDSSVVAACLAAGPIAVSSYTFATHDADGDERRHARLLTQALGLSLHECFYRLEDINIDVSLAAHLPRPLSNYVAQSLTRETARLREEQGVDAHFSGSGGDNIFCLLHSAAPLVDQVRAGTTPAALWRSVRDLSRLTTASALEIVRLALIHGRDKRQFRPAAPANPFLRLSGNPHLAHRFDHPWLQAPDDIPPGKVRHVALLALAELGAGSDPARDLPPVILPLLAQPLVELCLAIPAWKWFAGGVNRAPVRAAFSARLPEPILRRTSKGGPSSFLDQIYAANRPRIAERLLDGRLASAGLIERASVEQAVRGDRPVSRPQIRQLLCLASVEAWMAARAL